jgi:hypothetical protein
MINNFNLCQWEKFNPSEIKNDNQKLLRFNFFQPTLEETPVSDNKHYFIYQILPNLYYEKCEERDCSYIKVKVILKI